MHKFTLVIDFDKELLSKINNFPFIVHTGSTQDIVPVYRAVTQNNSCSCVVVHEKRPFSSIELNEEWKRIPVALYVPEMGSIKKFFTQFHQYREYNLRIFMLPENKNNYTHLRILSSLGVHCGIYLNAQIHSIDWDAVNDLMYYDAYTKANHARIEPFGYVISYYNPKEFTYFNTVYFENPRRYLYIDKEEHIALSREDLEKNEYIASGFECVKDLEENDNYKHKLHHWHSYFLDNKMCAYCPAWRICQGVFLQVCSVDTRCYQFFTDLLEAADHAYAQKEQNSVWQL